MKNRWYLFLAVLAVFMLCPPAFCCTIHSSSIGDLVWNDQNKNGIQEDGEPGLADVKVNLLASNSALLTSYTTDSSGFFEFDSLSPGDYYLRFDLPSGFSFSPSDQGSDDTLDSNVINDAGLTIKISLYPGENDKWDAGAYAVPIPGAVWLLGSGFLGLVGLRKKLKK
ncbi:MAG: hypothetical protein JW883_06820 [Deltaproteobacteria bacterium]|nr:hypothetical protein [Deltaproteobacteria bacterium]